MRVELDVDAFRAFLRPVLGQKIGMDIVASELNKMVELRKKEMMEKLQADFSRFVAKVTCYESPDHCGTKIIIEIPDEPEPAEQVDVIPKRPPL